MSEITGRNVGKTCRTHYRGTFNDGTQFDSSYDRGEPLEFVCGAGQMIKGFDAAVADMEVGEVKEIHLMPEEAYGMPDPNAILELEIASILSNGTSSIFTISSIIGRSVCECVFFRFTVYSAVITSSVTIATDATRDALSIPKILIFSFLLSPATARLLKFSGNQSPFPDPFQS